MQKPAEVLLLTGLNILWSVFDSLEIIKSIVNKVIKKMNTFAKRSSQNETGQDF